MSESSAPQALPGTAPDLHSYLRQQWREVLAVPDLDLDDNFFEIGGDSFKAVQLNICLDNDGYRLDVYEVFEAPTIREQADLLTSRHGVVLATGDS